MVKISFQQLDDLKTKLINAIQVVVDNDLGDIEKTINLKMDNDDRLLLFSQGVGRDPREQSCVGKCERLQESLG